MLFSILMCTYNSEETLRHAVTSVLNQKCEDWELIILDNGSGEATVELLHDYEKRENRISCIYRKDNVGWCKGISICLEQASGDYMMFLGADDYLAREDTLQEVKEEVIKHHPDIIWTGCAYAIWENGIYKIATEKLPDYQVYDTQDKLNQLTEIMKSVHYNSVMHYVNIDFLKKYGINFYKPFYGDCQGMTEALCKAKKMVVLDKVEYVLTVNTSQTASKVNFNYNIERQWKSVRDNFSDVRLCSVQRMQYVSERILRNLASMLESIVMGDGLRDDLMNDIDMSFLKRFEQAECWISSDAFGELMYYAGREKFAEQMIGAAGALYWECTKHNGMAEQMKKGSKWLAVFVEAALEYDANGTLVWKRRYSKPDAEFLIDALQSDANKHRIGCELPLKDGIVYECNSLKEQISDILNEYLQQIEREGI